MRSFKVTAIAIALLSATAGGLTLPAQAQPPPSVDLPPVIPFPPAGPAQPPGQTPPAASSGAPSVAAGCAPMGLFRAVVRNVTPGLMAADRLAQPRTFYRQGATFMRVEEQPDPVRGEQNLVIIAEPNIWVLNQGARTGQHSTDPGPELVVRAPILPVTLDTPALFRTLEFGCENQFVAAHAPREQQLVRWGTIVASLHTVTQGDQGVVLLMDQRGRRPLMISYIRGGKPVLVLRYDEYRLGLPERPALFTPPNGYRITESKGGPRPLQQLD